MGGSADGAHQAGSVPQMRVQFHAAWGGRSDLQSKMCVFSRSTLGLVGTDPRRPR
jgi:hypothetical protein